jgi:hypothetical protein
MSRNNDDAVDDPVISSLTILAVVSFVIGGLVDKYVFHNQPPMTLLFAVVCLLLLFDVLNGIKNRLKKLERKVDAALEKLDKG